MFDAGNYGCFTGFGQLGDKPFRIDIELTKNDISKTKINIEQLAEIPTFIDRENEYDDEEFCISKF